MIGKVTAAIVSVLAYPFGLLGRMDRWIEKKRHERAEAYLAGAESLYDLEFRMRQLAREMDHPRFMRQY